MQKKIALAGLVLLLISSASCRRDQYRVNISGIDKDIEIMRLEKDIFSIAPGEEADAVPYLRDKYGEFLQLFSNVINTGDVNDDKWEGYLHSFITDRMVWDAYQRVSSQFEDISDIENQLSLAFRHYLWHFPDRVVPGVFTCITGFNNSIIVADTIIGISLDRYLGADTDFYGMMGIYSYLARRMDRQFIVPDCMYAWGSTEWDYHLMDYGVENLISRMLHEGKLYYFMRSMMPDTEENIIFGFTPDQMKFCRNNEDLMWGYLVEHDMLFTTDQFTIRKLVGEAPFTTYFTRESPGKAALWIGFRMVEQYMRRNPSVTLPELMEITDYQKILSGGRYDP